MKNQLPKNKQIKPVNLFRSGLPMRADLKTQELKWQRFWTKIKLFQQLSQSGKKGNFILHSGPPYANGDIHIGHALNLILKDFTLRYARLQGFNPVFVPGWDTHGLPIANAVLKTQNVKVQNSDYRLLCEKYALKQMERQQHQFQRLGVLINWTPKYWTCQRDYIAKQLNVLAAMAEQNLLFYALKPVFWSWSSKTALAETEIEYKPFTSQAVFVAFPILDRQFADPAAFLVWTTTPWTLVANRFLAVNQTLTYVSFQMHKRTWIMEKTSFYRLKKTWQWKITNLKTFPGQKLLKIKYQHCYLPHQSIVIDAEIVQANTGTGVLHLAPAFGAEDFDIVQKLTTKIDVPLDENGCFNAKVADPTLDGLFYQKAQPIIIQKIIEAGNLLHQSAYEHQYPHDWRTHQPVIYRATKQLFANLTPLRARLHEQLNQLKWTPSWGKKRLLNMLNHRQNWCLSRQRKWGVPLPLFFTVDYQPILVPELIKQISKLIAVHGDQIWWDWPLERLLSPSLMTKYKIAYKSQDTIDVWFDSGCSLTNLYPHTRVDLIWEGNDQFRGWFNSLMIVAAILRKANHLGQIATHGFVNDETGLKMSKSRGNIVDPLVVCQQKGADVLRLWVASTNYYDDVTIGPEKLAQVSQSYLKIRLTMRFLLDNLHDFNPKTALTTTFSALDKWILYHAKTTFQTIKSTFKQLNFHHAFTLLIDFCNNKLSAIYFHLIKKALYLLPQNALFRRQHQTTMWYLYQQLLAIITVFIPHTAEEIFQTNPNLNLLSAQSVHLLSLPKPLKWPHGLTSPAKRLTFALQWHYRFYVRGVISKHLEAMKTNHQLRHSRYAQIHYTHNLAFNLFNSELAKKKFLDEWKIKTNVSYQILNQQFQEAQAYHFADWKQFFQVNHFTFQTSRLIADDYQLTIKIATGTKCLRCHEIYPFLIDNYCQNCGN